MDRGQSLIIPTLFDSTNYVYQKVRISIDWDDANIKAANFNSRTLNALFNVVTNEEFKKISLTEIAKEAWTILQTTYEGTKAVKDSKLERLTMSFEKIKMEEMSRLTSSMPS